MIYICQKSTSEDIIYHWYRCWSNSEYHPSLKNPSTSAGPLQRQVAEAGRMEEVGASGDPGPGFGGKAKENGSNK